jgi:hypothetical protein
MPDISVNFAGIKSPNPFWLASAPPAEFTETGLSLSKGLAAKKRRRRKKGEEKDCSAKWTVDDHG